MIATITPQKLHGSIDAIASKSVAHRMIIAAALANGDTHISCNTSCEDIEATIGCLTSLGARITPCADGYDIHPLPKSTAYGLLKALAGATLDCGESGSTLRFLLPVVAALGGDAHFVGRGRLVKRPLRPLSDEMIAKGCSLSQTDGLPLTLNGRLQPGEYSLPGNISSQFISGLLMAFPLMDGESSILVRGTLESAPYVALTAQVLQCFGVTVVAEPSEETVAPELKLSTQGNYRTCKTCTVEGDWSNAAFWLCAGALGSSTITVSGLSHSSAQGDRAILAILSRFGAKVGRVGTSASVRPDKLIGFDYDAHDTPDLVPIIAAVASLAQGSSRITNCARLRIKESDRLKTVCQTLQQLGAHIEIRGDDLLIEGVDELTGGDVDAAGDHRIAMMAAIAASRANNPVRIHGAEAVAKSYPNFFDHYRALRGVVELSE
ncbi:3-phosphoshikimate 1-carboxyvinyltransferase [Collinsella sp. zg1085]|uniref:3-phosphoshikimate 1-carboxyvinyltransferase n=1 Tax=Collinsella sp. zg1085 TaxID=2844380 RepID=UPI001C0BA129|nr:3-phosphoshikimate 1-carboxyvinyltransferase [Collinsella sp. zg1085]QWT17070.1 3-phosphoshikimate 1-carboxyvinyltransferase [Collinsella sp. zg1085]